MNNKTKWTAERVQEHLDGILRDAMEEEVSYLNIALVRQGLYKQIWPYWKEIFAHDEQIMEVMMRIDSIFEAKLYHAGLNKKVSPWLAMFGLKYNHKWEAPKPEAPAQSLPQALPPAAAGKEAKPLVMFELSEGEYLMAFSDPDMGGIYKRVEADKPKPESQTSPEERSEKSA